jgi:WD40 repeat protein
MSDHSGSVNRMAFSGDGKWLATASDDQTVRLWELESHKSRVLRGHTGPVADVLFAPDD